MGLLVSGQPCSKEGMDILLLFGYAGILWKEVEGKGHANMDPVIIILGLDPHQRPKIYSKKEGDSCLTFIELK